MKWEQAQNTLPSSCEKIRGLFLNSALSQLPLVLHFRLKIASLNHKIHESGKVGIFFNIKELF